MLVGEQMPQIQGLEFNEDAYRLLTALIAELKNLGHCEAYLLTNMNGGKGQLRLADQAPSPPKKKAREVFVCIDRDRHKGARFTLRRKHFSEALSDETYQAILEFVKERQKEKGSQQKGSEKVEPSEPGTLQAGQFESNRRKH